MHGKRREARGERREAGLDTSSPAVAATGLDPMREHDACGVGFVAQSSGARSHEVVQMALEAVARVAHRGAASTDNSGDGAGLLTQIPHRLFHRDAYRLGLRLDAGRPFAIGVFFLPVDPEAQVQAIALVEQVLLDDGLSFIGWRDVPVNSAALGTSARHSQPFIRHALIGKPERITDDDAWERALFLARRAMEQWADALGLPGFYVTSMSCQTIVYKALLQGTQLPAFYPDFRFPEFESALAIFHQRYSTNTMPSWPLAQPFRMLAHNGEINTLWGNRNAMTMRTPLLRSPLWEGREDRHASGRLRHPHGAEGSQRGARGDIRLDDVVELLRGEEGQCVSPCDVSHWTDSLLP